MICSPLLAKQYFPRQRRPAFTDWETRSRLCFLSWSTIMHPLGVEFKYTVRGQGIITCNRGWWEGVRGGCRGEVICPQKSSTFISEPKSWIRPFLGWKGRRLVNESFWEWSCRCQCKDHGGPTEEIKTIYGQLIVWGKLKGLAVKSLT